MRHLLTHTSGIDGDIFTDTGRGDECVQRYVDKLAGAPSVFTPGAAYSYCNSGYVVLGRIIEVLDRQSWDQSLRQRLTRPLRLTRTVTLPEEAILHRAGRRAPSLRHPGPGLGPAAQRRPGWADHRHGAATCSRSPASTSAAASRPTASGCSARPR